MHGRSTTAFSNRLVRLCITHTACANTEQFANTRIRARAQPNTHAHTCLAPGKRAGGGKSIWEVEGVRLSEGTLRRLSDQFEGLDTRSLPTAVLFDAQQEVFALMEVCVCVRVCECVFICRQRSARRALANITYTHTYKMQRDWYDGFRDSRGYQRMLDWCREVAGLPKPESLHQGNDECDDAASGEDAEVKINEEDPAGRSDPDTARQLHKATCDPTTPNIGYYNDENGSHTHTRGHAHTHARMHARMHVPLKPTHPHTHTNIPQPEARAVFLPLPRSNQTDASLDCLPRCQLYPTTQR